MMCKYTQVLKLIILEFPEKQHGTQYCHLQEKLERRSISQGRFPQNMLK